MKREQNPHPFPRSGLLPLGSLVVAGALLMGAMVTGRTPGVPIQLKKLISSASEGAPKLTVVVDGVAQTTAFQGGGYVLAAQYQGGPLAGKQLDASYRVCSVLSEDQCGSVVTGAWGSYVLDSSGSTRVSLGADFPLGVYKAQFRPRNQTGWQWSDEVVVRVYPSIGERGQKAAYHKLSGLRAGMVQTSAGNWSVQDFAFHLVNPSTQNIDVLWKFVADDPNFVFTDGARGTKVKQLSLDARGYQSLNVAGPEIYPFEIPTYSNFTGSVEFIGCVRGSNPCVPAKFYAYLLPETPEKSGVDPNAAWYEAWDEWKDVSIPVGFDQELGSFVVPYTNYWHNVTDFPKGWYSQLSITNTGDATAVYRVEHVPDAYSKRVPEGGGCSFQTYSRQTANVSVPAGAVRTVDLQDLFGWSTNTASFAEGYVLVKPPEGFRSNTIVGSKVLPGGTGIALCPSHGTGFGAVSIVSPSQGGVLQGSAQVVARVVQPRGTSATSAKLYVDGQPIAENSTPPLLAAESMFVVDTDSIAAGPHQLMVKIFRNGAEVGMSGSVAVIVKSSEHVVTYNGNDAAVKFAGPGWVNFTPLVGAYKDDEIYTGSRDASATLRVTGTRIKIYGAKAYNRGKMEVYIDGVSRGIIDPYSSVVHVGALLFDSGNLPLVEHEVKVVNRSIERSRPFIGIDKIVVTEP